MLTNLMAMIAKKDNGTRTVAIAATAYRLLMSLDNEEIAEFESTNAYEHDSAKSGASALTAAEDRALLAETAHLDGNLTIAMLWDIANKNRLNRYPNFN